MRGKRVLRKERKRKKGMMKERKEGEMKEKQLMKD